MKNSTKRRFLALLLSLVMLLALAPTALLEDENADGGETGNPPSTETDPKEEENTGATDPNEIKEIRLGDDNNQLMQGETTEEYLITLEPNASSNQGARIEVTLNPSNAVTDLIHVIWAPTDSDVVRVSEEQENGSTGAGHVATLFGKSAGKQDVTVTAGGKKVTIHVTVSGLKLLESLLKTIEVKENETVEIKLGEDFELYGSADSAVLTTETVTGGSNIFVLPVDNVNKTITIQGRQAGNATVKLTASAGGRMYTEEIRITVLPNLAEIDWTAGVSPTAPLYFSALESLIAQKCQEMTGDSLASIVGVSVPTAQGIIYHGYKSADDTGAGAASSATYYASTAARGPYIKDLTFVPNPSFGGEKATISFTGNAANGRTFKGKINITLADAKNEDVTVTTRADAPLKLKSEDFVKVCQEQTGGSLDYVIFTLPPATQGVLYRDYVNELDYAARVTASDHINRKGLDDVTFVPAKGWVGTVTIRYAGYSTTGLKYESDLIIKVERALDESIQYQDYGAGQITFRGSDFDAYSEAMTHQPMGTAGRVSFTLPPASQGILYNSGSIAAWNVTPAANSFSLTQLDYVTFVAADGFDGVVRIPFTGQDRYGTAFSGTLELHIQAVSTSRQGDINYSCQPGQSVKLQVTDFANLCQSVTGERLYYVTFQALPDYNQGSLFYNRTSSGAIGTRTTTAVKYFNSATPYLNNVSFWAGQSFSRVEIPFTLAAVGGETFTGLMVISSGEGAVGGGRAGAVTYTTSGQQPVTFVGAHFDAACRQATNSALNYLKLSTPSASQGMLYYDYRGADVTPAALDPSTALYLNGEVSVGMVTFVPARGFTGVAAMSFTATAINGSTYQGTVEVTVRAGAAYSGVVHYETSGEPVQFQSLDLTVASSIGQPVSIRFTSMPAASQGRVYYQYTSPIKYSWLGNTTASYSITGDSPVSNLTFVPRAGYEGVVSIPYTAAAADGTSSAGSIEITVTQPRVSRYFDDMDGYSSQTKSAVDSLSSMGVVYGMDTRTYGPKLSLRRGDFCLMLYRAFKFDVNGVGEQFKDVASDAYYADAVHDMYALGVVTGMGDGTFQPNATITRQDAALMVRRALDKAGLAPAPGSDQAALAGYKDRSAVSGYAEAALGSLVRTGVFPAAGDTLSPKAALTRADMALLLHRAITNFS